MRKEDADEWLQHLRRDTNFLWTEEAERQLSSTVLQPSVSGQTGETRLIVAVLEYYLRRRHPISVELQARCVQLLGTLLRQDHSAMGMVGKVPAWLHILRLRFTELYPLLNLPSAPSLAVTVQSAGYLGALVKLALQVHSKEQSVSAAIETRQSHFDYRAVLSGLPVKEGAPHLPIPELFELIDKQPVPEIRPVDMNQPYQVRLHAKLPKQHRFLIHEAVLNARYRLATRLVNRSPKQLLLRDSWNRNPLHIAKTVGAETWVQSMAHHQTFSVALQQKDGLGRTPLQIEEWKKIRREGVGPSLSPDNGGWDTRRLDKHQGTRNDVDIVEYSQLSWKDFVQNYAACSKPVLIRGVPNAKEFQRRWEKDRFVTKFSQTKFEYGDVPYAQSLGRSGGMVSFSDFIQKGEGYVFGQLHPKVHSKLLHDIPKLGYLNQLLTVHTQFYQGAAGTGAPMHLHIDAWNCLVFGEKRWFLAPPGDGVYSSMPISEWIENVLPTMNQQFLECRQYAGDILYVPKHWSHAVLNTQESIGIAREFLNPYLN